MMAENTPGPAVTDFPGSLMSPVPDVPENRAVFRMARMLLLLDVARRTGRKVETVDRLGYYEFLADSPFIVVEGNQPRSNDDRLALELAGFTSTQLSYASSGQRFASRRRRLQHDLARLFAYGLVELSHEGYQTTAAGAELATQLNSVYADAYRTSADVVLRRLSSKSNKALEEAVNRWLGESWLLIDLLDDVAEAVAPPTERAATPEAQTNDIEGHANDTGVESTDVNIPGAAEESSDRDES